MPLQGKYYIVSLKKIYILITLLNRRRLRLQYPKFAFLPCFAHQCNLAVGDIFKESNEFKIASKQAITIVGYFNNAIHSYFIGKLREVQKRIYSNYITLICPGDTRWNSYCYCFKSLIKSRQALRVSISIINLLI